MKSTGRLLSTLLLSTLVSGVGAADWPQWRGPAFNGSSPETGLPAKFSATENVAWVVPMPGASAGTPVVYRDAVYVSTIDARSQTLHAMCLHRQTGKVIWQHKIADGTKSDDRSNYSSPSPVTDGKIVVFFYGNGELVAFDLAGKEKWRRNIQKDYGDFAFQWTFSASPTLHGGKLYLQVLQRDQPVHGKGAVNGESYLLGIDPATGKTLWRQVRPTDAQAESREAFSTPVPFDHNGKTEILISGGDMLSGHDPETGKELWRWGTWNPQRIGHWRLVPSPVAGGGVVLACAPKKEPVYAVKLGGSGTLPDSAVAWTSPDRAITADVPTPAFSGGDFFVLSDVAKTLTRISPEGKVKWTVATPGRIKYEASPLVADGKVYVINFNGEVVVFGAEDGSILHQTSLGTSADRAVRSSIIAAHGQIFVRTDTQLFCIGKAGGVAKN